jgi:hypothetical protein
MRALSMTRARMLTLILVGGALFTASLRAAAPVGHFAVNGNIVTDTVTGLVWQRTPDGTGRTYTTANAYCANNTAGLPGTGWRLPTIKELSTIFDASAGSPRWDSAFGGAASAPYWSADSRPPGCPGGGSCQLELDFSSGVVGSGDASSATIAWFARCVR